MGIFSNILAKIFPANHPAVVNGGSTVAAPSPAPTGADAGPAGPGLATMPEVDVEKILSAKAEQSVEKLNWRASIVDLMKLLGLDSSLTARKQLAGELHYSGDMNDSAAMNLWLQTQVMSKLAANGGKLPSAIQR